MVTRRVARFIWSPTYSSNRTARHFEKADIKRHYGYLKLTQAFQCLLLQIPSRPSTSIGAEIPQGWRETTQKVGVGSRFCNWGRIDTWAGILASFVWKRTSRMAQWGWQWPPIALACARGVVRVETGIRGRRWTGQRTCQVYTKTCKIL